MIQGFLRSENTFKDTRLGLPVLRYLNHTRAEWHIAINKFQSDTTRREVVEFREKAKRTNGRVLSSALLQAQFARSGTCIILLRLIGRLFLGLFYSPSPNDLAGTREFRRQTVHLPAMRDFTMSSSARISPPLVIKFPLVVLPKLIPLHRAG